MSNKLTLGDIELTGRVLTAPMTGVTDLPFRRLIARLGASYVATEMVACAEFARGRPDQVRRAAVGEGLGLMVVQLVGATPEWIAKGAEMAARAGAHIIDLNFGCPAKSVSGLQCGSAVMRDPDLATRLTEAARTAGVPVTVKMRLGWDDNALNAPIIARSAQDAGAQMITVHGRTKVDMYRVPARWEPIRRVREAITVPLLCNGDIVGAATATAALAASGADGIMVGRAVMTDPWTIARIHAHFAGVPFAEPTLDDRRHLLHAYVEKLVVQEGKSRRIVSKLRKTIGSFSTGLRNAARLRQSISAIDGAPEAHKLLDAFFDDLASRGEMPQPWHEDVVSGADEDGAEGAVTGS